MHDDPARNFEMNRRTVTKGILAAAAIPLLPSSLLPASGAARTRNLRSGSGTIRLGIVGYGIRSKNLLDQFMRAPGVRLVGLAEVCPTRRQTAMTRIAKDQRGEFCVPYQDGLEMLAAANLDAVVITTPDHAHATNAVEACRRDVHVYCEKPLSRTINEGRAIADAAAASGIAFQVGSQQRSEFSRHFVRAAEFVRNGFHRRYRACVHRGR